jgi:hypothetical protein
MWEHMFCQSDTSIGDFDVEAQYTPTKAAIYGESRRASRLPFSIVLRTLHSPILKS